MAPCSRLTCSNMTAQLFLNSEANRLHFSSGLKLSSFLEIKITFGNLFFEQKLSRKTFKIGLPTTRCSERAISSNNICFVSYFSSHLLHKGIHCTKGHPYTLRVSTPYWPTALYNCLYIFQL